MAGNAELFVREDPEQFGLVGARVEQALGYTYQAFGNTTNAAIRNLALSMERDGFDA